MKSIEKHFESERPNERRERPFVNEMKSRSRRSRTPFQEIGVVRSVQFPQPSENPGRSLRSVEFVSFTLEIVASLVQSPLSGNLNVIKI